MQNCAWPSNSTPATMAKKQKTAKHRDNLFFKVVQGRVVSTNIFARYSITIIAFLFFMMVYISNKYECQTKMETIQKLEQQLEIVKTESVRERSRYMSRIRESAMTAMIDTLHLGLEVQERPPFSISYSH